MNTARVSKNLGAAHQSGAVSSSRRLPVAGKLRPGVKVLTKAAASNPALVAIYNDGVAAGASFDDIAAAMAKVKDAPKFPMTPKNVGYFVARQCDFSTPGAAATLLDLYGEVRHGDPERHIYTLPIIFPSDDVDLVFREQFEAWRASELHRWSEADPVSGVLQCMRRVEVAPDKTARKRWGGRPTEAERPCDPNNCVLFGKGECKHIGSLAFWVPGVTGTGVIELTFTSIYASLGIAETLEMVRAGLGRISGLHNGKPIFWLSKGRERVSRMNWETGKPEKTDQWIIRLEASGLDMVQVLSGVHEQAALPAPERAEVRALEAPTDAVIEEAPVSTAPTTAKEIKELRSQLGALRDTLEWEDADLKEWVDGQGYTVAAPAHDLECLKDMVAKLTEAVAARERRSAEPLELAQDQEETPF
jgi:hypothetical protein